MKYRRAQLNAISRSYTERNRKHALEALQAMGIDYEAYCRRFNYKASPCHLLNAVNDKKAATMNNVKTLLETE